MQLEAPTYKWKSASFSSASQFSAKNLTKGNHFCVCLKCYSPCCIIYSHCCTRPIDDKPHPREVKNNVFTVLLPLPRNCTLIITEKYIKNLNMTTGSQIEGKKILSSAHTPFSASGAWMPTPAGGEEKRRVWEGNRSCGMNPATLSSHFSCWSDAREPQGALQVLAPSYTTCGVGAYRSTPQVITHLGTGGANLQWARGKSRGKEKKWKGDWWWVERAPLHKQQRIKWERVWGKHGWE